VTYDDWKTRTPDDHEYERCVRDDSTECSCSRCQADEDRFWDKQGEGGPDEIERGQDDLERVREDLERDASDSEDLP